jgi:hypothetical protein
MSRNKEAETPLSENDSIDYPNMETWAVVSWLDDTIGSRQWISALTEESEEQALREGRQPWQCVANGLAKHHEKLRDDLLGKTPPMNIITDLLKDSMQKIDWGFLGRLYVDAHNSGHTVRI